MILRRKRSRKRRKIVQSIKGVNKIKLQLAVKEKSKITVKKKRKMKQTKVKQKMIHKTLSSIMDKNLTKNQKSNNLKKGTMMRYLVMNKLHPIN